LLLDRLVLRTGHVDVPHMVRVAWFLLVSHAPSILVCEPEGTGILGLSYDQWPYTIFHEQTKQSEVVSSNDVNQTLKPKPNKPAPDHP